MSTIRTIEIDFNKAQARVIEQTLVPVFFRQQLKRMAGIKYFGVRQAVSETSDVVTDASIKFIADLRSGKIDTSTRTVTELHRLFAKYVNMSLKQHRSGRIIRQLDGSYAYPEVCVQSGFDDFDNLAENSALYEHTPEEVNEAVKALETDPQFELLKLRTQEGWGQYQIGHKLGTSWFIAEKEVEKQRQQFIKQFAICQ